MTSMRTIRALGRSTKNLCHLEIPGNVSLYSSSSKLSPAAVGSTGCQVDTFERHDCCLPRSTAKVSSSHCTRSVCSGSIDVHTDRQTLGKAAECGRNVLGRTPCPCAVTLRLSRARVNRRDFATTRTQDGLKLRQLCRTRSATRSSRLLHLTPTKRNGRS